MKIASRLKALAAKSRTVRHAVLQYRIRTGQPHWAHVAGTTQYSQSLATARGRGQRVLMATSLGGYLMGTRMESLLAAALTTRGAEVHAFLCEGVLPACHQAASQYLDEKAYAARGPGAVYCDGCFSPARRTYESLGIRLHRFGDYLGEEDHRRARAIASELPFEAIRDYKEQDLAIGDQAVAGALRFFGRGHVRQDPVGQAIVRRYLEAAILTTVATRRLFQGERFDAAVFHHGIYVPQGLIGEVARQEQVRVVNWHVAYRKKCFIFSHGDTYHRTLMEEPTAAWEDVPWSDSLDKRVVDYLRSRWNGSGDWISYNRVPQTELQAISEQLGIDFSRPCIGLLTNVMWDAQIHYKSLAFKDMLDWVLQSIDYFSRRPELQLLIRVHPAETKAAIPSLQPIVDEISQAFPKLPSNVFVVPPDSPISTYAAMMQCNAAIIYATKMGIELTAMGIPVIVAGEAWIRNKNISHDVSSNGEYFRLLDQLPFASRLSQATVERARKYAFHFFFRRMIPIGFAEIANPSRGMEFNPVGVDTLRGGADEGLDVICDGILTGSPFVYPAEHRQSEG